jgi:membrane-associated phospholipid phosphatase
MYPRVLLGSMVVVCCGLATPLRAQTTSVSASPFVIGDVITQLDADQSPPMLMLSVAGQDPQPQKGSAQAAKSRRGFISTLFHNLGDDVKHIPRRNSVYWLAAGTGMSLAIHPADDYINEHMRGSGFANNFFKPGRYIGSFPVMFGASLTTYVVGRRKHSNWVQHLGMDLIEATLLSEATTQLIKVMVRRDRPIPVDGPKASGYSFPSGHASVTFAAATVLQQHFGWRAAVPTYLVASYVAMSRLTDERHWASDVVAGATEGIIIGRSVTFHGRHYFASPMIVPGGVGMGVMLMK